MSAALHVATTQESLWAESSHPLEGRRMVECKLEVCWLRAWTVEVAMTHGGNEVTAFDRFNDFYGFGASLEAGMERALELCGHFGIGTSSSAVMEVRLKVCDQPAIRSTSPRALEAAARGGARTWRPQTMVGRVPIRQVPHPYSGSFFPSGPACRCGMALSPAGAKTNNGSPGLVVKIH